MTPEQRARDFLAARKTLLLATVGKIGVPTASQAPFVRLDGDMYVYTSALSRHTNDMKETGKVSLMVMEDEAKTDNIFARKRITFTCGNVEIVSRGTDEWKKIIDLFEKTFGFWFEPVKPLGDFTLFRLIPFEAVYIEGFGQAYRMNKDLTASIHVRGTGPGAEAHAEKPEGS